MIIISACRLRHNLQSERGNATRTTAGTRRHCRGNDGRRTNFTIGDAASLTTNEAETNVQVTLEFLTIMQTTHGFQNLSGLENEVQRQKSPTTPQGQATYDDLVHRDTITPRTEPETPSRQRQQTGDIDTPAEKDSALTLRIQPLTPVNYGVLVGRETIALTQIERYATTTPHIDTPKKYKKPKSGSKTKQHTSRKSSRNVL